MVEAFAETSSEVACVVVATPEACMAQVGRYPWDLVLVDLRLGPHDGHHLLESLSEDGALGRGPVYVLSSSAAPDDIERAKRFGIHGYLRKPFTIDGWLELARSLAPAQATHHRRHTE